jgi:hypothetical protein
LRAATLLSSHGSPTAGSHPFSPPQRAASSRDSGGATPVERLQLINCFDQSAFALPAQFTFGNLSRNALRGPKFVSTDLTFTKNVPVGTNVRLQIRAEIFNVFNTVNYGNPNASFGSAAFGRITGAGAMRQMQLGGKLLF